MLQKQNRIEHLEHSGAKRDKKFQVKCGNYGGDGHNRLTCIKTCSTCGFVPYCGHLINKEDKDSKMSVKVNDRFSNISS